MVPKAVRIQLFTLGIFLSSVTSFGQRNLVSVGSSLGWYKADIIFNKVGTFEGQQIVSNSINPSFAFSYVRQINPLGIGLEVSYKPLSFKTEGLSIRNESGKNLQDFYEQKIQFISLGVPIFYKLGQQYSSSFAFLELTPAYNQMVENVALVNDSLGMSSESRDEFGLIYKDESQISYSVTFGYRWKFNNSYRESGWVVVCKGFFEQYFFLRSSNNSLKYSAGVALSLGYSF